MDKELQLIDDVLRYYDHHSISMEDLRDKNILGAKQHLFSTHGKNMTTKGCFEPVKEDQWISNVRIAKVLKRKPTSPAGYFEYYLDENQQLLCARDNNIEYGRLMISEDHHILDWDEDTKIYGYSTNGRSFELLTIYTKNNGDPVRITISLSGDAQFDPESFIIIYVHPAKQCVVEYSHYPVSVMDPGIFGVMQFRGVKYVQMYSRDSFV